MLTQAVFGPALIQILATPSSAHQQREATAPRAQEAQPANQPVFALDATYQQWLTALDLAPESLIDFLASPQRLKLGVYHERLWQYFLTHSHETELICANLKARHKGQDLGEFDLIYQHHKLGLVHCEIASKYYLADGEDDKAAWSQRIQHVIEAASWQKIRAQSACACHDIEAASIGRGQALLAHDVGDDVCIVALAQKELLLGLGALLAKDIVEAIISFKVNWATEIGAK